MKTKLFTLLLAIAASVGAMFASTKIGDLYYNLNATNQTAEVTCKSWNNFEYNKGWGITTANIPASVEYNSVTYSVTSIGIHAFENCSGLTSVTIPNSVTSIGGLAFDGCSGLTSVTIPNSVTSIGGCAFYGCTGLTSVTIPNSVTSIGEAAFRDCTGLTSVTIPNSVTSIGDGAFSGCTGLTSIEIPNSVTSIGNRAFYGCTGLTSVTIPNSVTSIGQYAFYGCTGLTSVTIPNSVTDIGDQAFRDCTSLTSVIWNAKNYADFASNNTPFYADYYDQEWQVYIRFDLRPQITSFTFGNEVEHIPANLCNGMSNLTSIEIPNSVTSIGNRAFYGCTGLTSVTIGNSVTSIGIHAFENCSGLTSVTIPNSVTSIGGYAFENCTGLTSVTIPNSVTYIGGYAFENCSGLTSVTIPNSVTSIGEAAFRDCTGLTSVTIPNSVTSIENQAFYGCSGLTSVTINSPDIVGKTYSYSSNIKNIFGSQVTQYIIGNSVTSIGANAFYECTGLTSVTIPNSVTSIGGGAFYGCTGLTSVTIPNSVTSIGESAFYMCTSLTSVTIPNSVTSIGGAAFRDCTGLTSVTIPNSVTSIGGAAFRNCRGLTSIEIPNSVTSIGEWAFSSCTSLTSVTIPNSVTSIGKDVFAYCRGLTSVTIPNSVTSIGDQAFYGCAGLTSVTIPNSVTSIGIHAFENCTGLTSVTIGNSVTSIGDGAFNDRKIDKIYFSGTMEEWLNKSWTPSQVSYSYSLFINDVAVTNVVIPNSVTSIGIHAFENCSGLTSVTIPNSVTSIGDSAFYRCSGLTSVTIGNSVTSIGERAFEFCSSLTSVTIPNSVTSIGDVAFWQCSGLTSVTIGNSVTSIGNQAFDGCSSLTSVTIEAEIPPTLGSRVFIGTNDCPIYVPCGTLHAYKAAWPYFSRIQYAPPYKISTQAEFGSVGITSLENYTICDEQPYHYTLTVTANYGYHFTQWSDGNTDNPRTIILASDTTFTAEFAKNTYTITAKSSNPQWGTTAGDNSALYLDEVEISATANYGYHFVKWNDNNTSNPRTISVTEDKTYTATFAKNVYSITNNAEHGSISGGTSAEYLDEVTLTANPDYGYHFTQWSDGNKENPRTFVLTQDTTFNAEFAIDKTGNCGDDNALIWTYDAETKTLTITGNGTLNSNYYFGIEAPTQMQKLVIGNEITSIGDSAFYGMSTINHLIIGGSVATIGNYAFAECRNFDDIICYATTVPIINATTFENVGNKQYIYLYVPEERERAYYRDEFWGEFDIRIKGTEETTTNTKSVTVEPADNTALFTWPIDSAAATYSLQISKDGEVFCTLTFNANGQLTGIAFAPSRNGAPQVPAATTSVAGMSFTVTGLNAASKYAYHLAVKDEEQNDVQTYSGEFATTGYTGDVTPGGEPEINTEGIEDVLSSEKASKILHNGQIFILRGDKTYTLQGQEVK